MDLKKTLHRIAYLKWLFLITQIVLIFYCFIVLPENLIDIIGIIIFVTGIQLGLESLGDIEKMSLREQKRYQSPNYSRRQSIVLLSAIGTLIPISLLFMSLKFIFGPRNATLFNSFFDLGLDCWALILGLLCLLKNVDDKKNYVASLNERNLDN